MPRQAKAQRALTHQQIWTALDRLAVRAGLSASGLARRAGLDPTTFNKSKRITLEGRERWPSTESLAKALAATHTSIDTFVQLLAEGAAGAHAVPILGFAQASGDHFDDSGFPSGGGWGEIALPAGSDQHAYALKISGEAMKPVYRDGTIILVSPASPVRRGDRVVVKTRSGELVAKELKRRTAISVELTSLNPSHVDRALSAKDVLWMARIVWASQ